MKRMMDAINVCLRLMFSTIIIYAFVYLVILGSWVMEEPDNTSYIPKSSRRISRFFTARLRMLTTPFVKVGNALADCIDRMKTRHQIRRATSHLSTPHVRFRRDYANKLPKRLAIMVTIAMSANHTAAHQTMRYDTDSGPVGIDNRCTACISHRVSDFDGLLEDVQFAIKGFGGSRITGIKCGTIMWRWADDNGDEHKFCIPNLYYVPAGKVRLLSPQHLAQATKDKKGTGEETNGEVCRLYWKGNRHQLTVPLGEDNVATFPLSPGYTAFQTFCHEAGFTYDDEAEPIICQSVITDDESEDGYTRSHVQPTPD